MKLEKFQEKNNKKKFIILFTVCCILLLAGVFLYTSFAVFTEEKQFNVINGQYQDPGDLYFAVYIDGEVTNTFPNKNSGYTLDTEKSSCTNGATVLWDNESWSALVNFSNYSAENMSRTKCTMYFKERSYCELHPETGACNILAMGETEELKFDKTTDNNLRYVGANPNNYVSFNNELWRIIGVMNNIDNGSGTKETRVKIIRDEFYSTRITWDSFGFSYWDQASLMGDLDNIYFNLQSPYKEMIGDIVWNLGGSRDDDVTTSMFYESERGIDAPGESTWIGRVGLMYTSDYGYATSGSHSTSREACLGLELYNWDDSIYTDCKNNDWLYDSSNHQWTLTSMSGAEGTVFAIFDDGALRSESVFAEFAASPVLYLSSNVRISGGTGSSSNPFTLVVS